MSDTPQGPGWWQASDGKWYPPTSTPGEPAASPPPPSSTTEPFTGASAPMSSGAGRGTAATAGDAFNYGWLKFQQNIGPIIIAALIGLVVLVVGLLFTIFVLLPNTLWRTQVECTRQIGNTVVCETEFQNGFLFFVGLVLLSAAFYFGYLLFSMAIIRGALMITNGQQLDLAKMFSLEGIGQYLLGSVIIAFAALILGFFCFFPAVIVWFFGQFFGFFILDKKMNAFDAIFASVRLVNKNLGSLIGFYIGVIIATVIGSALCGLGLLVAIPVIIIATAFMYRRLQDEPVAA